MRETFLDPFTGVEIEVRVHLGLSLLIYVAAAAPVVGPWVLKVVRWLG